ncbi:hypothetical protein CK623_12505 [Vandammella animalimorsus]|uniref:Uncharacterized protein n=1 Tax=Vandammella animalimorsus TaxID=2029117 RepID=A0A2A2AK26_9BURK|nr:hypothetical protein CK623_12505 [Vandammella animalimorsus]
MIQPSAANTRPSASSQPSSSRTANSEEWLLNCSLDTSSSPSSTTSMAISYQAKPLGSDSHSARPVASSASHQAASSRSSRARASTSSNRPQTLPSSREASIQNCGTCQRCRASAAAWLSGLAPAASSTAPAAKASPPSTSGAAQAMLRAICMPVTCRRRRARPGRLFSRIHSA